MTNEKINIKIALVCGAKNFRKVASGDMKCDFPGHACRTLPNYESDLNAMHEAAYSQGVLFRYKMEDTLKGMPCDPVFAEACQRAEAFLRVLGLWEEDSSTNTSIEATSSWSNPANQDKKPTSRNL